MRLRIGEREARALYVRPPPNAQGPPGSFDPIEPGQKENVRIPPTE